MQVTGEAWAGSRHFRHPVQETACLLLRRCGWRPKACTALAHKLARLLWHLLKYKQPFNPEVFTQAEERMKRQKPARLQNLPTTLNHTLVPDQ